MFFNRSFAALADPNRQAILQTLKKGECPVSTIAATLDITLATLSHHLDILKRADLISARRSGRQIFYSLNMSVFEEISEALLKFIGPKQPKKIK
jgi:DNA-binding transcriptional ArsR family regulator